MKARQYGEPAKTRPSERSAGAASTVAPGLANPPPITSWHGRLGNEGVQRLLQPKLAVGQPDDSKGPCSCGGGCPRCAATPSVRSSTGGEPLPPALRAYFETIQGADFSGVRVHPQAPEVTAPLRARAVTRGQDIYFHPGQFRPDTPHGDALIGHELAHTLQTRQSGEARGRKAGYGSQAGDALERQADALARGERVPVLAAPAGAALRSPFDSESAEERARRETLLQSISNALDRVLELLRTGGSVESVEVPTERGGVGGVIYAPGGTNEFFVSYADRDARLRRIVRSLIAMGTLYRRAPIPADFPAPTLTSVAEVGREGESPTSRLEYETTVDIPEGPASFGGARPEWVDLQAAYTRYQIAQGRTYEEYELDGLYLDPASRIVPGAARGAPRLGRGVPSGAYMVVPDIDHEPLRYWRLDGYSPIPRGSVIVEFWHDDFGYYYMHRGRRIDVPSPWSR